MKTVFQRLLVFLFSCFTFQVTAQAPAFQWAKSFGDTAYDYSYSMAADHAGNVITIGDFNGSVDFDPGSGVFNLTAIGYQDMFILKLDAGGNFVWAKQIAGIASHVYSNSIYSKSITVDQSDNIFITGGFTGTVDFDPGSAVMNLSSVPANRSSIFFLMLDSPGNLNWVKQIDGSGFNLAKSIAIDDSGNIYATGLFRDTVDFDPGPGTFYLMSSQYGSFRIIFVLKLNASGDFKWAKAMIASYYSGDDYGIFISADALGNVYYAGAFTDSVDFDPGPATHYLVSQNGWNAFISKLDSSGNYCWAKSLSGNIATRSFVLDSANIYLTGDFTDTVDMDPGLSGYTLISDSGIRNGYIANFDTSGNFQWVKCFREGTTVSGSIVMDHHGSLYTTGYFFGSVDFDPGAGSYHLTSDTIAGDTYVSKLDHSGNFVWAESIASRDLEYPSTIDLDPADKIFVTGFYYNSTLQCGPFTLVNADPTSHSPDVFIVKLDNITGFPLVTKNTFGLFPNPANDHFTIQLGTHSQEVNVEIFDATGKQVRSIESSGAPILDIDTKNFPPGIYCVMVNQDQEVYTQKIVIY